MEADPRTSCGTRCSCERVRPPPSSSWTLSYRSWTPPLSSYSAASTWTSTLTTSTESGRPPAITALSLGLMYLSERKKSVVRERSSLPFLLLPKGKKVGYKTGHLCTFCGYQRERKRGTGQVIFVLSVVTKGKRKRGTGGVIFVLSVVTKGKTRRSLFFTENNLSLFAHVLYFYPLR